MNTLDVSFFRRRYILINLFTWLAQGLSMPGLILLTAARGIDLATIGILFALHGITVVALELPTGGLADVLGRRGVLIVSSVVGIAAMTWLALATSVWEFVVLTILRAVSRALSSGPDEAWYVDAVHELDPGGNIRTGLAHGQVANSVGLGAGTIVGGAVPMLLDLPGDGLIIPLSVPPLAAAACFGALLWTVMRGMVEPRRDGRVGPVAVLREVPANIIGGFRLGLRDRSLTRLLFTFVVVGVTLTSVELLTPGRMDTLAGGADAGAFAYGIVVTIGFAASALGSSLCAVVTRLVGDRPRVTSVIGIGVSATGLIGLFGTGDLDGTTGILATGGGYAAMFLGMGLRNPVISELIHHRITSRERATMISIQSMLSQGGGSLAAVGLPLVVVAWSVPGAWLVSGLLLAASAVLFRRTSPEHRGDDVRAAVEENSHRV